MNQDRTFNTGYWYILLKLIFNDKWEVIGLLFSMSNNSSKIDWRLMTISHSITRDRKDETVCCAIITSDCHDSVAWYIKLSRLHTDKFRHRHTLTMPAWMVFNVLILMIRNYMSPRSSITNDFVVWLEQSILLTKDGYDNLQTKIIDKSYYGLILTLMPYLRMQWQSHCKH